MKYLALVIMAGLCLMGRAQDTLTLTNKKQLLVKLTEISETQVKYKKWDDMEGPVYVVPVYHVYYIKRQNQNGISANIQPGADTIVTFDNVALPVKIIKTGDWNITYKKWDNPAAPNEHIALNRVIRIHYHNGRTVMQANLTSPNYHAATSSLYGPTYDSLMRVRKKWCVPGAIALVLGPICTITGVIIMSNTDMETRYNSTTMTWIYPNQQVVRSRIAGGAVIVAFGIGCMVAGTIAVIKSGYYNRQIQLIRKGVFSMSYPVPGYILPTAQNNFQKGFSISTGITF